MEISLWLQCRESNGWIRTGDRETGEKDLVEIQGKDEGGLYLGGNRRNGPKRHRFQRYSAYGADMGAELVSTPTFLIYRIGCLLASFICQCRERSIWGVPEDLSLGNISFKKPVRHTTYCSMLSCVDYSMIKQHPPKQNVKSVIIAITSGYLSALLRHIFLSFQPEINRSEHLGWPS